MSTTISSPISLDGCPPRNKEPPIGTAIPVHPLTPYPTSRDNLTDDHSETSDGQNTIGDFDSVNGVTNFTETNAPKFPVSSQKQTVTKLNKSIRLWNLTADTPDENKEAKECRELTREMVDRRRRWFHQPFKGILEPQNTLTIPICSDNMRNTHYPLLSSDDPKHTAQQLLSSDGCQNPDYHVRHLLRKWLETRAKGKYSNMTSHHLGALFQQVHVRSSKRFKRVKKLTKGPGSMLPCSSDLIVGQVL